MTSRGHISCPIFHSTGLGHGKTNIVDFPSTGDKTYPFVISDNLRLCLGINLALWDDDKNVICRYNKKRNWIHK